MKKKYVITLSIFGIILLCIGLRFWIMGSSCTGPVAQKELNGSDVMPLNGAPLCVEIAPGLRFKFDTGADISSINEKDLEKLQKMGYNHRIINRPIAGRDGYGAHFFGTKRVIVNLPIGGYTIVSSADSCQSLVYSGKPTNELIDVEFALTDKECSTFGLTLLQKFKQEFLFLPHAVTFHSSVPDFYQHVAGIETDTQLLDYIWPAKRPYLILNVNQVPNIFFLDTGLQRTSVKMPTRDEFRSKNPLRSDSFRSMVHVYPAKVDDAAWVELGNRSGAKMICYYDNTEDDYQFNPLNLYSQDMFLDLEGKSLLFRPTSSTEK